MNLSSDISKQRAKVTLKVSLERNSSFHEFFILILRFNTKVFFKNWIFITFLKLFLLHNMDKSVKHLQKNFTNSLEREQLLIA